MRCYEMVGNSDGDGDDDDDAAAAADAQVPTYTVATRYLGRQS